jgi:Spy/CpxP family protein refolding chaperone
MSYARPKYGLNPANRQGDFNMYSKMKSIVALVAFAVCAPLALAQDTSQSQQTPPPVQQNNQQNQGQMAPRGPMGPGGQMGRGGTQGRAFSDNGGPMRGGMNGEMHRPMRHPMGPRERMWARGGMGFNGRNGFAGGRGNFGGRGGFGGPGMGRGLGMMGLGGPMGLSRIVNNPDMREKLGITTEQAARIRQQETDFQKASVMNRAKSEVAHMELNQLMSADKPDRAAIDKKLSDISAAQLVSEQTRVHHQLDMKTALTPDQQAKLKELMQSRRPGIHGPGDPNGGPQGGPGRGGRGPRPPQGTGTGTPDPADGTIS